MTHCETCSWFKPLLISNGAGICFERWRHVGPYDAVPLTTAGESCDKHARRVLGEREPKED